MIPDPIKPSLKMLNEFKKFILKGNVVSLSTGVIIGSAFPNIVTAFTKGFVEPILAIFGGTTTAPARKLPIWSKTVQTIEKINGTETVKTVTTPISIDLGMLAAAVLGFLITAAIVFFVIIKPMNKLMELVNRRDEEPNAAPPVDVLAPDVKLLTEIRDLLKARAEGPPPAT